MRKIEQIIKSLNFSDNDTIKIMYGLNLIFVDLSKTLLIGLIALYLKEFPFFIVLTIATILNRLHTGGFHMKSYVSCLIFSAVYYLGIYYLTKLNLEPLFIILLGVLSLISISLFAPKISKARRKITINKSSLKLKAILISGLYVLVYMTTLNDFSLILIWVVIVQGFFIILEEIKDVALTIN